MAQSDTACDSSANGPRLEPKLLDFLWSNSCERITKSFFKAVLITLVCASVNSNLSDHVATPKNDESILIISPPTRIHLVHNHNPTRSTIKMEFNTAAQPSLLPPSQCNLEGECELDPK